jgi:hypothetical protein
VGAAGATGSDREASMRWRILLPVIAGAIGLTAGSAAALAAPAQPAAATVGKPIYAFNSGLVLSVAQKAGKGTPVRVGAYASRSGQRWVFGRHGEISPANDLKVCLSVAKYRADTPLELWPCDGRGGERFVVGAPSSHTPVFYLRLAPRRGDCLQAQPQPEARVDLGACAGMATQAWSRSNLAGTADGIGSDWEMEAQSPTRAGSPVTGANLFTGNLDQYWQATYTGSPNSSPVQLRPVEDTALCAAWSGQERAGARLYLASCSGSGSQRFTGIEMIYNTIQAYYYITSPDTFYCLQAATTGSRDLRAVMLGPCTETNQLWATGLDLWGGNSWQYQEIYAGQNTGPHALQFSMRADGTGVSGSGVELSADDQAPQQVWTALPSGEDRARANPDGSITLRPLADEKVCLTVPDGNYAAGTKLLVQTCDGSVDQEFVQSQFDQPTGLVAAGGGEFCVTAGGGIKAKSAVELEPCARQDDQTWSQFLDWANWPGLPLEATGPVADPRETLVLSGVSSTGGQVSVAASPGLAGWYTSQDWISEFSGPDAAIQSVYDRSLCLDAPGVTAGTQLVAATCAGNAAQTFSYAGPAQGGGVLWRLGTTGMCVAVGTTAGSSGFPLLLEACSASQSSDAWNGPSVGL